MARNDLAHEQGDAINTILAAAGYNSPCTVHDVQCRHDVVDWRDGSICREPPTFPSAAST